MSTYLQQFLFKHKKQIIIPFVIILVISLFFFNSTIFYSNYNNTYYSLIFIAFVLLLSNLAISYIFFKKYFLISLPIMFAFMFFVFYFLVPLNMVYFNFLEDYTGTHDFYVLLKSFIVIILDLAAFTCGSLCIAFIKPQNSYIALGIKKLLTFNQFEKKIDINKLYSIALFFTIFSISINLIFIFTVGGGLAYFTGYLENQLEVYTEKNYLNYIFLLTILKNISILILFLISSATGKNKFITSLLIALTIVLSISSRMTLIAFLFQLFIIFCLTKQKYLKSLPFLLPLLLILSIFFMSALGLYRQYMYSKDISSYTNLKFGITTLLLRDFHGFRALSEIIAHNKEFNSPLLGRTIILPVIQKPIPRSIWKDKEWNSSGYYMNTLYPEALKKGFSVAIGIPADAYINFGIFGSCIFFAILGALITRVQFFLINKVNNINNTTNFYYCIWAILYAKMLSLRGDDIALNIVDIILLFVSFVLFNQAYKINIKRI